MIIKEIKDLAVIKSAFVDAYNDVVDDEDPDLESFEPKLEGRKYIAGFVKGEIIGLVVYCYHSTGTMIHIMVKPKYRSRYAGLLAKKALQDRAGTIYTEIPDLYPNVIKFAESFGFKIIDRSKTCFKDGVEYAVNTLRLD